MMETDVPTSSNSVASETVFNSCSELGSRSLVESNCSYILNVQLEEAFVLQHILSPNHLVWWIEGSPGRSWMLEMHFSVKAGGGKHYPVPGKKLELYIYVFRARVDIEALGFWSHHCFWWPNGHTISATKSWSSVVLHSWAGLMLL